MLVFVLAPSLGVPALAAGSDTGYSDIAADAWYADAVALYRLAGSPAVSGQDSFTDTVEGSCYSSAVLWTSQQGLAAQAANA